MSNPQQPELRRSGQTPSLSPDAIAGELKAYDRPESGRTKGPVPPGNRPGTHDGPDADKPDMDRFAERLGIDKPDPDGERAHQAAVDAVDHETDGLPDLAKRSIAVTVGLVGLGVGAIAWVAPKVVHVVRSVNQHRPRTPLDRLLRR